MAGHFKLVPDPDHPQGLAVPLTAAEEALYDADQIAGAAQAAAQATVDANASSIRTSLRDRRQDALALADALDAGTATPAQQRAALALCLRGLVRVGRLVLSDLDVAS